MEANVGALDRLIRVVFGVILLAVPFTNFFTSDWVGQLMAGVAIVVGIVVILSGVLARCFVYKALGINTCKIA